MIHVAEPVISDSIDAALAAVPASGCIVRLPAGQFVLSRPIVLQSLGMTLEGECSCHPYPGQAATELIFPVGVPGIIVEGRPAGKGERVTVRGLCLTSAHGDTLAHGITIRGARTNIRDCSVNSFSGEGCCIVGGTSAKTNSNLFSLERSTFRDCGKNGLYIAGNNANKGTVIDCSFEANDGWGVLEKDTLGSNYFSCHASDNGAGAYCVDSVKASSTFTGCYSENGQPASWFGQNCVTIGGLHGAGIDMQAHSGKRAGGVIASTSNGLRLSILEAITLSGAAPPTIPGVPGQFFVIGPWGGKTLGWLCIKPGAWYQRVQ